MSTKLDESAEALAMELVKIDNLHKRDVKSNDTPENSLLLVWQAAARQT